MMTDYTPTTNDIDVAYSIQAARIRGIAFGVAGKEFDRWLQKVKAEAWAEGQQSGAKWGVQDWTDEYPPADNPYEF